MKYQVKNLKSYFNIQDKAKNNPEKFWKKIAKEFSWQKKMESSS